MNKLNDIKFSASEAAALAKKSALKGDWHMMDSMLSIPRMGINFSSSIIISKGNFKYAVKRSSIQFVCDSSQDVGTLLMSFAYLNGYPEAQKMLWYYLTGNAQELEVDTERLFNEDPVLKAFVLTKISEEVNLKKRSGRVNVKQENYQNQNWKNAFGSIFVNWTIVGRKLELWIEDVYDWHPDQARVSQCVHQAMSRAKEYGAKPFHYHGTKLIIDLSRPALNQNPITPP